MLPFIFVSSLLLAQPDELAVKSRRGKELMAAGKFREAIPVYQELVRALPKNPGLLLNLGLAEQMSGQHREAVQHFEAALKLQPDLLPASLSLGAAHLELNEPGLAVRPLQTVLAADPRNVQARGMLAGALFSLDRFDDAAAEYRKLAELDPQNPKSWYGLGRSYESLAIQVFEKLGRLGLESGYLLALIAETRAQRGQMRSAFYFYRQVLEKLPNLRGVHARLSEIYRKTNHPDWAEAEDQKERQSPPPDCRSQKIECEFVAGRYLEAASLAKAQKTAEALYWQTRAYNELARQAFSRLGDLPPSAELHEVKAEISRNQGQHLESVREWREALKYSPEDPRLERELATSLYLNQDYKAALALAEKLLRREPNSAELNFLKGDSLLHLERVEDAVPFLEKAVRHDSKLLGAQASLGLAYARLGKSDLAIPHLKAALETDEDGSLHYQLARAYQSTGQTELAKQMMERYQQITALHQSAEIQITPP